MFIKIKNKANLLTELKKHKGEQFVVHYICSNCNDSQVTDWLEIENWMIDSFTKEDCLYISYPCMNCGYTEKFLRIDNIEGIELE